MASFTVLRDVGETLKKMLKPNIPELSEESAMVFDSPADMESSTNARLSIFLYQTAVNSDLKNIGQSPVGEDKMQNPPLILDLSYIFTPYAQHRETELIIMERLMQVFHDNRVLKGALLQGTLKESGNNEIRVYSNSLTLEELNRLWGTFPNKAFKLSASYLLTPVIIPSATQIGVDRVKQKDLSMYRKDHDKKIFLEKIDGKKNS